MHEIEYLQCAKNIFFQKACKINSNKIKDIEKRKQDLDTSKISTCMEVSKPMLHTNE